MSKVKQVLSEQKAKYLPKLHKLDDTIEDFIQDIEREINKTEDNPIFVRKAHQLLADMNKEYSEFIAALRGIVNAVDREGYSLPEVPFMSKVRDVNKNGGPEDSMEMQGPSEEEEQEEEPKKKSPVKEALERTDEQVGEHMQGAEAYFKDIKKRIDLALRELKSGDIGMKTTDAVMRMARIMDEPFYRHFWS